MKRQLAGEGIAADKAFKDSIVKNKLFFIYHGSVFGQPWERGRPSLYIGAQDGQLKMVKLLLRAQADVDVTREHR